VVEDGSDHAGRPQPTSSGEIRPLTPRKSLITCVNFSEIQMTDLDILRAFTVALRYYEVMGIRWVAVAIAVSQLRDILGRVGSCPWWR
jgi:hypothetical protein